MNDLIKKAMGSQQLANAEAKKEANAEAKKEAEHWPSVEKPAMRGAGTNLKGGGGAPVRSENGGTDPAQSA